MHASNDSFLHNPSELDHLTSGTNKSALSTSNGSIYANDATSLESSSQSPAPFSLVAAFFLLGIGSLLPFNALLSVLDYFTLLFQGISIAQYICNGYTFPLMVCGISVILFPPPPSWRNGFVLFSFSVIVLISVLYPLLTTRSESFDSAVDGFASKQFVSCVVLSATLGVMSALGQAMLYGIIAILPFHSCTTAYNAGGATASVMLVFLRALTRLTTDEAGSTTVTTPSTLRAGFFLFFSVCTILCFACCIVFIWMCRRSPTYMTYVVNPLRSGSYSSSGNLTTSLISRPTWGEFFYNSKLAFKDIRTQAASMLGCFCVTLMLFPAITTVMPLSLRERASVHWASWFPLCVVGAFAVGDVTGRLTLSECTAQRYPATLPFLAATRFLFIPIVVAQWTGLVPTSSTLALATVLAIAFTNGFVMNMAFIIAPSVTTDGRKEYAGRLMYMMLNFGLSAGTASGWLLELGMSKLRSF